METAIDFLFKRLSHYFPKMEKSYNPLYKQAKEMEKQQTVKFTEDFIEKFTFGTYDGEVYQSKEISDYYNETYGSNGSDEITNCDTKISQTEISDEEIEAQALTFAKEESYGELNSDLWKGYVFGAKRIREQLKKK